MTLENRFSAKVANRLVALSFLLVSFLIVPASASANEHLYFQPWFKQATGDLRQDLAAAKAEGKRLTLVWEQIGCVYCKKMHEINFTVPEIVGLFAGKFYVVQMDLRGNRKMIDFDGEQLDESALARKHRVNGTPTIEFRDETATEVFRLPGYAEPMVFYGILEYVVAKAYTESDLIPWLKAKYANQG
ncbi:MAG TPA: thioredoxin [Rhodospirillales bacterium]|mgnify:CR=1 FL=1|nr:thioredoxin [Rhodospirillales bacterium]